MIQRDAEVLRNWRCQMTLKLAGAANTCTIINVQCERHVRCTLGTVSVKPCRLTTV